VGITVLGVGNLLMGDDGAGLHALKALKESGYAFPERVKFLDGGTAGLELLYFLQDTEKLLIIDAVISVGDAASIKTFKGEDIPAIFSRKFSVHEIGIKDLLFAMRLSGTGPREISLIGIQPKTMEISLELSPEVSQAIPGVVEAALQQLRGWGVEV
jgi:hydrogenase maturation protease